MSWRIAQQTGQDGTPQFRIWSTISEDWLTDWITRTEAIRFYYDMTLVDFKKKIIEQFYKFPHMWPSSNSREYRYIDDEEGHRRYAEWMQLLLTKQGYEEYNELIDKIYGEVLKAIGVEESPQ